MKGKIKAIISVDHKGDMEIILDNKSVFIRQMDVQGWFNDEFGKEYHNERKIKVSQELEYDGIVRDYLVNPRIVG